MTADYNGWNDLPEEEREALDQLELSTSLHERELPSSRKNVQGPRWRQRHS